MRRFLITTLFALSLFGGGMSVFAPMAIAQSVTPAPAASSAQAPAPANDASGEKPIPVTLGDNSGPLIFIMGLFAWLLGIAAVTLDAAVYYTVLTMGTFIKELSAIGITWTILRDIGNIALIFGFLVAGINTILETHFYGEGQKLIPTLIIVAVSLNFSLFVAEAVIDTGNMFATQIYSAINKGEQAGLLANNLINNPTEAGSQGVGGVIMAQMGLQTIYGEAMTNPKIFEEDTPAGIAFMAIILFLITTFVLFSLAFILVARFVILILVIITSPIGFIGYAIPPMRAKAQLWWHTLFSQTFTAPVLMLSLYVALSVITSPTFFSGFTTAGAENIDGNIATWTKLVTDPAGFGGMVITFLVAMGLLLAVNILAKDLSAFGASGAMKLAGMASFGGAAFIGQQTFGRGSGYLQKKFMSTEMGNRGGILARGISATLGAGAKSTFDARSGVKLVGVDAGKPQKEGFYGWEKEQKEALLKYAKEIKPTSGDKEEEKKTKESLVGEKESLNTMAILHESEMKDLVRTHSLTMEKFSDRLAIARQELEQAKLQGSAEQIKNAEDALGNRVRESEEERAKNKEASDALKKQHESEQESHKEKIKEYEDKLEKLKKAPKARFAEGLETISIPLTDLKIKGSWTTLLSGKTVESIKKELDKTEAEKAVDALKKAIEGDHGHDKKESHGEAHSAPSSKPAGGAPSGGHSPSHH